MPDTHSVRSGIADEGPESPAESADKNYGDQPSESPAAALAATDYAATRTSEKQLATNNKGPKDD